MKHLDEGTIHAWLDGALSDAEAREVGEHAASCPDCSARVAEARGFIAGASRILMSLDDAPRGVIPKRAPVTPPPKARQFWQAAPWVTGIAAVLMLAIGVKEWRERPSAQSAIAAAQPRTDSLSAALPTASQPVDSTLRLRPVSAPQPKRLSPPPAAELRRRATSLNSGAGPVAAAGTADAVSAMDAAPRQVAAPNRRDAVAAESAPLPAALERKPEPQPAVCIRVESFDRIAPAGGAAGAPVAALKEPTKPRSLAAKAAPATASAVNSILRLDTTTTAQGGVIRSPENGKALGTWFAVDGDSIRLVMTQRVLTVPGSARVPCVPNP